MALYSCVSNFHWKHSLLKSRSWIPMGLLEFLDSVWLERVYGRGAVLLCKFYWRWARLCQCFWELEYMGTQTSALDSIVNATINRSTSFYLWTLCLLKTSPPLTWTAMMLAPGLLAATRTSPHPFSGCWQMIFLDRKFDHLTSFHNTLPWLPTAFRIKASNFWGGP